eukprot:s1_g1208.t1
MLLVLWVTGVFEHLTIDFIRQSVESAGVFGPILFILLFGLEGLGVPGVVFMLTAVTIWPPELAFLYNWIGAQFAGLVGFAYARWIGRDWVEHHLPDRFRKYQTRVAQRGLTAVILVRLIFFIVPPAHWVLGLSSISLRVYLLGTAIGLLPGMFLISYGGGYAVEWLISQSGIVVLSVGAVVAAGFVIAWGIKQRRARAETGKPMNLLILVGSLRADSFSLKLARAIADQLPAGVTPTLVDGGDLPLYNQDLDGEGKPTPVQTLLDQVTRADALLFITPEFNYGIPGPLKNLIDWASRPAYNSPLKHKPALIIAHSIAPTGGARAHSQLSSVLGGTLTRLMIGPSFLVPSVHEKFNEDGDLTDELMKMIFPKALEDFINWAREPVSL